VGQELVGVVECAAQVMRGVTGLGQRGGGPNKRSPAERCRSWTRRPWDRAVDAPAAVWHAG
jgi:hypothetical protein